MKLHRRFAVPVFSVTLIASVACFITFDRLIYHQAERDRQEQVDAKLAEIDAMQDLIEKRCLSHASLYTSNPRVQEAYRIALSGNIDDEADPQGNEARAILAEECKSALAGYQSMTGESRYGLHFHLPNGRSLLRVWKYKNQSKSDDISSFRQTILDVNQGNHDSIQGVEVGRGGFAIRGIAPISDDDGKHLGSVEMLSDYVPLIFTAKQTPHQNLAIYMNSSLLTVATKLSDPQKNPPTGQYVLVASTDADITNAHITKALLESGSNKETCQESGTCVAVAAPILDYGGSPIGVLVYVEDVEGQLAAISSARWTVACGMATFLIILTCVSFVVGRRVEKQVDEVSHVLQDGATHLDEAAEQISRSAQTLANGATEQASSLEEASGALEELSSMANVNAESANESNSRMEETQGVVEHGNDSMVEASEAMDRISEASEQIHNIIKVIEEIAFQTNLLALNAAVEAARAGEHGKGFAVVAEEVRSLAQRASKAAGETGTLIDQTVQRVQRGVELSHDARASFSRIRESSDEIAKLIDQIAGANKEQAEGVTHISHAVSQMDKLTQDNAAGAEEFAAASTSLKDQSRHLNEAVSSLVSIVGNS